MTVLVTGGTGTAGRPTVEALRARGIEPRILSRRAGDGHMIADLRSGSGLGASLAGVRTVVHLATNRRNDVAATQRLLDAAQTAGVAHVVYLSIVGVDAVPLGNDDFRGRSSPTYRFNRSTRASSPRGCRS